MLIGSAAGVAAGILGTGVVPEDASGQTGESEGKKMSTPERPKVVAFDVIETLFDLRPMGERLKQAGLPEQALREARRR